MCILHNLKDRDHMSALNQIYAVMLHYIIFSIIVTPVRGGFEMISGFKKKQVTGIEFSKLTVAKL